MRIMKSNNGFTLLELMVTISILGIMLIFMSRLLGLNVKLFRMTEGNAEYRDSARIAANSILTVVRENSNVGLDVSTAGVISKPSSEVVLDYKSNSSNSNVNHAKLWYYFEPDKFGTGNGYGELRDIDNKTIATYIRSLNIEDRDTIEQWPYIKITIEAGKRMDASEKTLNENSEELKDSISKLVFCIRKER